MRHLRQFILILALAVCGNLLAQNSQKDLEQLMRNHGEYFFTLTVNQPSEIQAISELCSVDGTDGRTVVCFANPNQYDILVELGYHPQLQTPPSMLEKPIMWDGSHREAYDWDAYPTYEAYENMMLQFAAEHPDRCTYFELGTLDSGRKLMFCRINNGETDGKLKFLYTSTMHGNETTGFMLMLRLIDELCTSNDERIVNLVNNLDIFICPNTNPDGTYYGGNQTVYGARRENSNEIDLNRHYPDFDKGPHPDNNWCYQKETQWLMHLAQDYKFTMAANFHTGSEVVNYPWDTHPSLHADDAWWKLVCHEYADQCHEWDTNYMNMQHQDADHGIINGYQWYTISGSRQDYMNYYAQCREVTIETSYNYVPNASTMPMYWNYNHNSMLSYMEQCLNGIHGTITDAETGEAIEATVFIAGHDHHGSEVSSHLPAGDYHRPIKGGTYDVTYSAYGYEPQTITININDNEAVYQDVQLTPTPNTPLFADFEAEKELVTVGSPVRFNDLSKGLRIVSWEWQFEGGTPATSNERIPTVIYDAPGLFDVTLTVTDASGQTNTITKSELIDVYHSMPIQDGDVMLSDCKGLFLPSGGDCGHYGNNESFKMTVRPENHGQKVHVNFLVFRTQPTVDELSVYDGLSTSSPLIGDFSGFELPDSITATNPDGALTFTFVSSEYVNFSGWVAKLTCTGGESINEDSSVKTKVYPNPCQNSFTIEAEGDMHYSLYDCLGQHIVSGTFKEETQIGTTNLQPGIYFLQLNGEQNCCVEKLVIEK
jgi:PKD repeat protein